MSHQNPLTCYRCGLAAEPADTQCSRCSLKLDWAATSDLRSLDYLRTRITQWQRQGVIGPTVAQRMLGEAEHNRLTILRMLSGVAPGPGGMAPPPSRTRPAHPTGPETPAPNVQPPPPDFVQGGPSEPPPFFNSGERPPSGPAAFSPSERHPPRRSFVDALVDFGTVRLMLYAGALLLAAGILVWLRDTLREQLQKPMVQAGILAAITVATLSGGAALVARAKDRAEQRIIGRGFLLLGTLLLPLNPWFWLQSGLIEDRGNAWIVTLVTFAVSTAIAFGLGDRIFVVLSYAFAMATGWLLTYKLSGGAPAGAYALSIVGVSLVYVIGEWAVSRARPDDEKWEGLGEVMFWCGHVGLAFTVVFHSAVAWFIPGELLAAFRHFSGEGHTPWISTTVPALAALGYFWSAWRLQQSAWTFVAATATAWSVTEWLLSHHVRPGSWLIAAAVMALAFHAAGILLRKREEFGPALQSSGRVFAWIGFTCVVIACFGYSVFDQPVRVATTAGALLLAATFAADAFHERTGPPAFAATAIVWFVAAWGLHELGASWTVTSTVLAGVLVGAPFLLDRISDDRSENRTGARTATSGLVLLCGIALLALVDNGPELWRLIPLGLFVSAAAIIHGWTTRAPLVRYPAYAIGLATLQLVALFAAGEIIRTNEWAEGRYAVFLLIPYVAALVAAWFALGSALELRTVALRRTVRLAAAIAAGLAGISAFPLLFDSVLVTQGRYLFALAMLLLAIAPMAVAAKSRDGAVAHVEGAYGWLFVLGAWFAVMAGVVRDATAYESMVIALFTGMAPIVLAAIAGPTAPKWPAVGNAAMGVGCVCAVVTLPGCLVMLSDDFGNIDAFPSRDRFAIFLFGALSLVFALWRSSEKLFAAWPIVWSAIAVLPAVCIGRGAIVSAGNESVGIAAVGLVAVAVFGIRGVLAARDLALAMPALPIAHALTGVALLSALARAADTGVTWTTVMAFTIATAGYAVAGFAAERSEASAVMHRGLALVFSYLSYAMIGLRYELSPWEDSAYYTLPPGLLLVTIGAVKSRKDDDEGAGSLMWIGSLIVATPMLLHALENRYVLGTSSAGYDMATITLGLLLALVGRMVMYRGPFLVGAFVFVVDLFVVIMGAIRWQDLPPAVYLTALGALLFGTAWVLLYKREQLRRFSTWLGDSATALREWR